jgi:hypothetical protein
MYTAFELVVVVLGPVGIALCATPFFSTRRAIAQLGHQDHSWFSHLEDEDLSERPSEDDGDAPLPRRALRGRPAWI